MIVLWAFVIVGLVEPKDLLGEASEWKTWVSQNFTWLYIAAFVRPPPANAKFPSTVNPNPPARRVRFFRAATAVRPGATRHPPRAEGRIPPPARPSPNRPVRAVGSRSSGGPNRRLLTGHSIVEEVPKRATCRVPGARRPFFFSSRLRLRSAGPRRLLQRRRD